MFNMGMTEMLILGAIALIVIGPKRMPDLARAIGRGLTEFRKATNEFKNSITSEMDDITDSPEIKDLAKMTNQLKNQNVPKNIEDYLEKAADVMEGANNQDNKDKSEKKESSEIAKSDDPTSSTTTEKT